MASFGETQIIENLGIGFEAKKKDKLLTLEAFAEMLDFDKRLNELEFVNENGEVKYYRDLCNTFYDERKNENVSDNQMSLCILT